jgi:hypothetical protein
MIGQANPHVQSTEDDSFLDALRPSFGTMGAGSIIGGMRIVAA